jgi:putative aminopeptidase FrvX
MAQRVGLSVTITHAMAKKPQQSADAKAALQILRELCSIPTAPYAEQRVLTYAEQFAAQRGIRVSRDANGNLLLELSAKQPKRTGRLVLVAHTDHPGMVARKMIAGDRLEADFHGGVSSTLVLGAAVRFFDAAGEVRGRVRKLLALQDRGDAPARVEIDRLPRPVSPGSPGMFDLPPAKIAGKRFFSRACDDLAGAASALAALDQLSSERLTTPIAVLLTRAEEDAFMGALGAVIKPKLLRKTDRIISIECSAVQAYAPQGAGVILRVGDRTSVFDSGLSYFLMHEAVELAKGDSSFKFQRCLMPGGTCEATVFDAWGYTCAAVCVPMANYHNMDRAKKKIAAESIHLNDWLSMVKLLVGAAQAIGDFEPGMAPLRKRLTERFTHRAPLLTNALTDAV